MDKLIQQMRQDLFSSVQSVINVLLVFVSLVVAFGILSSSNAAVWQAFLPTLLLGLSYGVMSLSLDQLFREDWEDGTLEWRMSEGMSLEVYVFAKIITHWIRLSLPLTGIVGVISGFSSFPLLVGVATSTLVLTFLGAITSALCLTAKVHTSFLLPLLTLPIGIPMIIVSMAAISDLTTAFHSYFILQGGLLLMAAALSLTAAPFALKVALR